MNCQPIQSENIEEIQRSLLELHTEQTTIALKAIEATEKKINIMRTICCMPKRASTSNLSMEMKFGFITLKSMAWL